MKGFLKRMPRIRSQAQDSTARRERSLVNGEGKADRETLIYERQDFWATTSNKQLNFLQHVKTLLTQHGEPS